MSKIHLKAIILINKHYRTKAVIWYRHYLLNKFVEQKNRRNMNRDDLFYETYLSNIFTNDKINYNEFKNDTHNMKTLYNHYKKLDSEAGSRVTLKVSDNCVKENIKKDSEKLNLNLSKFLLSHAKRDLNLNVSTKQQVQAIMKKNDKKRKSYI